MECQLESVRFIETDLLPEMVFNRCFCETGSREFVEFESATVTPLITPELKKYRELYRARVIVRFSGEPKSFDIVIKLLSVTCLDDICAYGCFLNEEMFYNKMTAKYKLDIYPKCYAADMGRYGRPVIVLEDLEAIGYRRLNTKLDVDHLRLLLKAIGKFHGRGISIKQREFPVFREFYAKLSDSNTNCDEYLGKIQQELEKLRCSDSELSAKLQEKLGNADVKCDTVKNQFFTICHGDLNQNHSLYLYNGEKPIKVKILGWNKMIYTSLIIDLESILIKSVIQRDSNGQIHENFYEYFDTLADETGELRDELLRDFLLTLFYPRVISSIGESPQDQRELINFLNLLP